MIDFSDVQMQSIDIDDHGLDLENQKRAQKRLPVTLSWHRDKFIKLGSIVRSFSSENPWSTTSPFDPESLDEMPKLMVREHGTEATFRSQSTSSSSATKDHMTLNFDVSIGPPGLSSLASVGVSGTYNKNVTDNKDAEKKSIRATVRSGYIGFERQPRLKVEAIIAIKYDGGLPTFYERYGDYYVAGYRLGGDTGLMISGSNSAKQELEQLSITLKVKVLFVEASVTHRRDFVASDQASSLTLIGYDTLDGKHWDTSKNGQGASSLEVQRQGSDIMTKAQALSTRIQHKMDELAIADGDILTYRDCERLTEAGLVVELILLPVTSLRQVISWLQEDDVI